MDLKDFVPALAKYTGIQNQELLEKDVRLHLLLTALDGDDRLHEDLLFKGGTCLIKCFLGYWRFSEDLDFTWRSQDHWAQMGTKQARRAIRPIRRTALEAIEQHAEKLNMARPEKEGVTYGRSGQMMTVQLTYEAVSGLPAFVKLQINYLDPILYDIEERSANSLLGGSIPEELEFLEPDLSARYADPASCFTYDPREILTEKCRAILTRQAASIKDVLDLYLLDRKLNLRVKNHLKTIRQKTQFGVERRKRYRKQLKDAKDRFNALREADVKPLMLKEIDLGDFEEYRRELLVLLEKERERLLANEGGDS